jgi:tetratricopeptide (TPR) repeat protein
MTRKGFSKFFHDLLAKFLPAENPDEGQGPWLSQARALIRKQDWQALLDWCREWTQSEAEDAIAWFGLGDAYNRLTRYEDAIYPLFKSTSIDPNNADVWFSFGYAYHQLKRYGESIDALHKSVRIDPKNILAWRTLGFAYIQVKHYDSAILALQKSISIEPKDAIAWYTLGSAYVLSGKRTAAMDTARELRRLDTSRANNLFKLIEG